MGLWLQWSSVVKCGKGGGALQWGPTPQTLGRNTGLMNLQVTPGQEQFTPAPGAPVLIISAQLLQNSMDWKIDRSYIT